MGKGGSVSGSSEREEVLQCPKTRRGIPAPCPMAGRGLRRGTGGGRAGLPGRVRGMQAKLHRWAGEDSSRRFGDLFNLVCDPDFLAEAWSASGRTRARGRPASTG